jgi:sortase (surface protein transpeptidase)
VSGPTRSGGGRGVILAATAALALAACGGPAEAPEPAPPSPTVSQHASPSPSPPPEPSEPNQLANPVRVRIPAIGVDARVVPLAIDSQGTLEAPDRFDVAGWNRDGPEPGEDGTAVIAGHVDSRSGPAVFFRLRELADSDLIHVDRADGTTATFEVTDLARYDKDRVPSDDVYGSTGRTELRLITCGGEFDQSRRSYRDNVIVFAVLTSP